MCCVPVVRTLRTLRVHAIAGAFPFVGKGVCSLGSMAERTFFGALAVAGGALVSDRAESGQKTGLGGQNSGMFCCLGLF